MTLRKWGRKFNNKEWKKKKIRRCNFFFLVFSFVIVCVYQLVNLDHRMTFHQLLIFIHFEKFFFLEHQLMMWIVFWFEFWEKTWIWKSFFFVRNVMFMSLTCFLWFVKQKNGRKRNINCNFFFWICVILCSVIGEISSTNDFQ